MKLLFNLKKKGFGYLVVIAAAAILFILLTMFSRVQSSHLLMQSMVVRNYLASALGEAALSAIVAELNANRAFSTHWYYRESAKEQWASPIKSRETLLGKTPDIYVSGVSKGLYTGGTPHGEFKAKIAPMYSTRENSKTQTLLEGEMYTRAEILTRIGGGWGSDNYTHRKITALIERRYPAAECLLYDGEMLDTGSLGPYNKRENPLRRGRLYGYHYITFTAAGHCKGSEIYEIEKISTPGFIRGLKETRIEFADGYSTTLSANNDSLNYDNFDTHQGFILDGNHGGTALKLTRLPRERIKNTAHRYRKTYGVTILEGDLPHSNYKNPYNPSDNYVDLDFGEYRPPPKAQNRQDATEDEDGQSAADDSADHSAGSDDPLPIKQKRGQKILVYAEVPLRIWGNPDRSITIYSTKDIVIAGDFNQSINTRQVYTDSNYTDYAYELSNGIDGNKVGALIMSEGRILIDISRPTLFAKNEIKPFFLYSLAHALNPSNQEVISEIRESFAPVEQTTRRSLVGLGGVADDGTRIPRYGTIAWLYNNQELDSGGNYDANMEDLIDFFTPGLGIKPRFGIKDAEVRNTIIEHFKSLVRVGGDLTIDQQDRIFQIAWDQAVKEEAEDPSLDAGAMGMMMPLFEEAQRELRDGIYIPEITINATLISSARRSSTWRIGNSSQKIEEEIGNTGELQYLKSPAFIIQRIYGSVARLATKEPQYFISGAFSPSNVLRRRVWDSTNLKNAQFRPLEMPAVHRLMSFMDDLITANEYDNYK